MDDRQFDALSKQVTQLRGSRLTAVRGIAAGALLGVLAATWPEVVSDADPLPKRKRNKNKKLKRLRKQKRLRGGDAICTAANSSYCSGSAACGTGCQCATTTEGTFVCIHIGIEVTHCTSSNACGATACSKVCVACPNNNNGCAVLC